MFNVKRKKNSQEKNQFSQSDRNERELDPINFGCNDYQ